MQLDYLKNLNDRYEDFINNKYKGRMLTIDVDNLDFLHSREDFAFVIRQIDEQLSEMSNKERTLFSAVP